ncbi:MAG: phosphoribosylanthranilate isomerase [Paludibacteraceae bacterium]|nr:phosphoribosylanthranilate isomerase [Paludibacteraceae bacterium]
MLCIKVCGMKYSQNIVELADLNPNFMGFIFYPKSPRYAESLDVDILNSLPLSIKKIGVFVNEDPEVILSIVQKYRLDGVQLHGNESPEICKKLREEKLIVLKTFSVSEQNDFLKTDNYDGVCDYFLFDTKTSAYGGSGLKFDWSLLNNYKGKTSFLLSGGINDDDIVQILKISHSKFTGLDLNSKFELQPGLKDIPKLQIFFQKMNY